MTGVEVEVAQRQARALEVIGAALALPILEDEIETLQVSLGRLGDNTVADDIRTNDEPALRSLKLQRDIYKATIWNGGS